MLKAQIIGTGSYAPKRILTNKDIEKLVDTSDEWIMERTGIRERHVAEEGECTSDLALEASKKALKMAGLKAMDIDMIVIGTITGDLQFPATACLVQKKLGAKNAVAFDVNAACSGFMYALSIGNAYIKSGAAKHVLAIGAEVLTKFTDWKDRTTCVLFGDGAGAVVLGPTKGQHGILSVDIHSDGSQWELIHIPAGGSQMPPSQETVKHRLHFMKMKGNETFKVAVKTLEQVAMDTLKKHDLTADDIDLMIPHQANLRIIQATASRLGLPMERVMLNLERYGNTSAASIPIALDEAVRSRRIRHGDNILMEAFGAGATWASALVKWSIPD